MSIATLMREGKCTRDYNFHGVNLRVSCSSAMAACLDARFRMLPPQTEYAETVFFDFESVHDPKLHWLKKPQGRSRSFYELPHGEATYFEGRDEIYLCYADRVRAVCRPGAGRAAFSVLETEPNNLWLASHLFFTISLIEILKRRGSYGLHAAGLHANGKAVLIPGTSGAGKSTLAIALLRAKFDYLSDDMVFLTRRDDGLHVLAFPEGLDISDETLGFFPELHFILHSPKEQRRSKRKIDPDLIFGTLARREARAAVIVFPRTTNAKTSIVRRIDPDEALVEIACNMLLTEPRSCQAHLDTLGELVRVTPCYRLETGRDFHRIPGLFRELLA